MCSFCATNTDEFEIVAGVLADFRAQFFVDSGFFIK